MAPGNVPTGIPTGVGSLFSTQVLLTVAPGTRSVLPAGSFYVYGVGADIRIQVIDSTSAWNNLTAAGTGPSGVLVSDGASLAVFNGGAGNESVTYIRLP